MHKIFSYVVKDDTGVAPNVDGGICTLAVCKPRIRRTARVGDWIVGLWPVPYCKRVCHVMRVGRILTFDEYWNDPTYAMKKPSRSRTPDNFYRPAMGGKLEKVETWVHCKNGETEHDLSCRHVLVADCFWYFGGEPCELPEEFWELDEVLGRYRRDHRVSWWEDDKLRSFIDWLDSYGEGVIGTPRQVYKAVAQGFGCNLQCR